MDQAYKPTTHGLAVMAACLALERPFKITRVAFGSGKVDENTNLADVHELLSFVTDGAVCGRRHENDRFFFTIQFSNAEHPEVNTFYLSEFMVFTEDPETGEETDLIYGTLGDYRQAIPAYNPMYPPSTFNFPLTLILSNEINAYVTAPAGLVTYQDLGILIDALGTRQLPITIPVDGWQDNPDGGAYAYRADIPVESVTAKLIPQLFYPPESAERAGYYGFSPVCETLDGLLRVWSKAVPAEPIPAVLNLTGDASGYFAVGDGNTGSGTFTLPPATENTLGGVKVGSGLNVTRDGTLSVNAATEAEVNEMLTGVLTPENK